MKKICTTLMALFLVFVCLFSLCSCEKKDTDHFFSPEDVIAIYEAEGYTVYCWRDDNEAIPYDYYLKAEKEAGSEEEESIYFSLFFDNDSAKAYAEDNQWNLVLWFFSLIYGDPSWVKVEQYGNLVAEYENKALIKPLTRFLSQKGD